MKKIMLSFHDGTVDVHAVASSHHSVPAVAEVTGATVVVGHTTSGAVAG